MSTRSVRRAAAVSLLLWVAACGESPTLPDPLPGGDAGTPDGGAGGDGTDQEDAAVNDELTAATVEEVGLIDLPEGAGEVQVDEVDGTGSLRAVFTLPSADLDAWCQDQAFGPSTPMSRPPDADGRARFAIADDVPEEGMRRCLGSAPDDPSVQREVIATGTDGEVASVHLVVQVFPGR